MKNKNVIITGANSGIGKAATIKFAREGYTVIMACRNLEKSRKVQEEIVNLTNNKNVDLLEVDMSSINSIKKFFETFKSKYNKLDILINNAAYFNHSEKTYQLSKNNVELTFATNTVGPFLLSHLLRDMLKNSDDPRILNACTTNIRHYFEPNRKINFENLRGEFKDSNKYSVYKMYGDSKIALLMITFKMAELFKEDNIKINAIQIPAIKITDETMKQFKSGWKIAAKIQNFFSNTQESMADTYYHICTSEEFKNVTGKLINDKLEIVKSSHYKENFIESVKQFLDKSVYPKYADDINNINKIWEFCVTSTKEI